MAACKHWFGVECLYHVKGSLYLLCFLSGFYKFHKLNRKTVIYVYDYCFISSTPPPSSSVDLPPPPSLAEIREKRLVKRSHVIRELIKTEEDYLQDVVITINDIMKPLLEREVGVLARQNNKINL